MIVSKKIDTGSDDGQGTGRDRRYGGPVFLPRRRSSALAKKLLSEPWGGERVTPYDEQWFLGRPRS